MANRVLPNFFIVGAGKAGTTSLHEYLSQHPQIFMSKVKEPGYFASELRAENLSEPMRRHVALQTKSLPAALGDGHPIKPFGWLAGDWNDYLRLFQQAGGATAIGEASAAYLWSATAAANIHKEIPQAKIVMVLRNPVERAYSQYLHQLSVGLTRSSFTEHLDQCRKATGSELSIWYPFLEVGLYAAQVRRFLTLFPRKQIRIYWYEDDWRDHAVMLRDIFAFLRVDVDFCPDTGKRSHERRSPRMPSPHYWLKRLNIWYPLKALVPDSLRPALRSFAFRSDVPKMTVEDRKWLIEYYRDDVCQLALLLDRKLNHWLC